MANQIPDRVAEQLKRVPGRWIPRYLQSEETQANRRAFLESIKREFKGNVNAREQASLAEVRRHIAEDARPDWLARNLKKIRNLFEDGRPPERFDMYKTPASGEPRGEIDLEIEKLYKRNKDVIRELDRDLHRRGIKADQGGAVLGDIFSQQKTFVAREKSINGANTLSQSISYERLDETGRYYATQSESTLKRDVQIDRTQVDKIDIADLEKRMAKVDWKVNYFDGSAVASNDPAENQSIISGVGNIFSDLLKIRTSKDTEGARIHDQLAYKYFADTPNVQAVGNLKEMQEQYEVKAKIELGNATSQSFSPGQMVNLLEGRPVKGKNSANGEDLWYQMDLSKKDERGAHSITPIVNSEKVMMEAALLKAGVERIRDPEGERDPKEMLKSGDLVQASLIQNGIKVDRMISMDIVNNGISIDNAESIRRQLMSAEKINENKQINQYKNHMEAVRAGQNTSPTLTPGKQNTQEIKPKMTVVPPLSKEKDAVKNLKNDKGQAIQPRMTKQMVFASWEALQQKGVGQEQDQKLGVKRS